MTTDRTSFLSELMKMLPHDSDGAVRYEDIASVFGCSDADGDERQEEK